MEDPEEASGVRETREAVEANPFWSDRARDEMALRAMRPQALPPLEDQERLRATRLSFDQGGVVPGERVVATVEGMAYVETLGTEVVQVSAGVLDQGRPEAPQQRVEGEQVGEFERFMMTMIAQVLGAHPGARGLEKGCG